MPSKIEVSSIHENSNWAVSAGGRAIRSVQSSKEQTNEERSVLFVGGVHGDEPEGVELAHRLEFWLKNATLGPAPVQVQWHLIPCLNVDGYTQTPHARTNASGVDLNRNFPTQDWSPEYKAARYFPGTKPASEPEVQALVQLIKSVQPDWIFHFHSYDKPCNVYTGERGSRIAKIFERHTGYPAKDDIGYATPGSLGQFGGADLNIPVLCLEERDGINLKSVGDRYLPAFREFWSRLHEL